jgi:elongator complex protein 1
MRNLRSVLLTELQLQDELLPTATAWDTASDTIICTFGPAKDNAVIDLRRRRQDVDFTLPAGFDAFELIASWDAPCPLPGLDCDRILSLQYFADNLTSVLVLEGGDIIIVREDPRPGEEKIEIMGSVDVGITAATWSPDEELLAITTKANTFLYMTREFENIAEITFTSEDLKASRHVSVGWGKKETQFQGKRAKVLRDPTMPETVGEGKLSNFDDGKTTISWRGDGAFVAVNSIDTGIRRVIRVYSREGALDSVSEPIDGLEGALSWRPAGNLMASVQRLGDRVDVVFFERNGLRHGQFTLRIVEEEQVSWGSDIHLSWNIDSTVLAVRFRDRIQLWTMGNYHYYLKQELPLMLPPGCKDPCSFRWHQEKALRFAVASPCSILDVDLVFDICHGSTTSPDDVGAVAVIDGKILKLTPLRMAGVPPPMAHCEVTLDSNIVDVSFSRSGSRIAVLTRNDFSVFVWSLKGRPVPCPVLESNHPLPEAPSSRPRQILFLHESEVHVLINRKPGQCEIQCTTLGTRTTKIVYQTTPIEHIHSIFSSLSHEMLWLSHTHQPGKPISYSTIIPRSKDESLTVGWSDGPNVDTFWAEAIQQANDYEVAFQQSLTPSMLADMNRLSWLQCLGMVLSLPISVS